ncbi:ESX secretion-associated protein EspG [Nocardia sp. NEAU-G5]|uniref:ESX secretion-associated protein EspG n=1 Tax=Nocardia albiluteola TaxID=2842303 RepID=A0ABS6BG10_9NOCA|nr:ESX secretion-associated protein EspG [Nocardia albiluteola]MBU3068188.1 ESX secretion-associated protein EspG [Nocardia albiluteola]
MTEMHRTWTITDLEFIVLRDRLLNRYLPWPFTYVGPVRTRIDFLREQEQIWSRLQANWDPDLAEAIVNAGNPDARVQIRCWDGRDMRDPASRYFMVGNRCGSRAVLIHGLCDRDALTNDRYRIVECDAQALSSVLVDSLPEMPAGSQGRVELMSSHGAETVDHWSSRSSFYDDGDDNIDFRSTRWQRAPRTTVGIIEIRQGKSKFGPRGMGMKRMFWEDHPGDGRYLIDLDPPLAAIGIDATELQGRIDQGIAEMLRMVQDESREGVVRTSVFDD